MKCCDEDQGDLFSRDSAIDNTNTPFANACINDCYESFDLRDKGNSRNFTEECAYDSTDVQKSEPMIGTSTNGACIKKCYESFHVRHNIKTPSEEYHGEFGLYSLSGVQEFSNANRNGENVPQNYFKEFESETTDLCVNDCYESFDAKHKYKQTPECVSNKQHSTDTGTEKEPDHVLPEERQQCSKICENVVGHAEGGNSVKHSNISQSKSRKRCCFIFCFLTVLFFLVCAAGFALFFLKDIDECLHKPCTNGATCLNHNGNFSCSCSTGWKGYLCAEDIDECLNKPCTNGATCLNHNGNFSCSCSTGWKGQLCAEARDCTTLYEAGLNISGNYTIFLMEGVSIPVYCNMSLAGGGWTVIQRRESGTQDFNKSWEEYKTGFGQIGGEFWLGNENILKITQQGQYELRVDLVTLNNVARYALYDDFSIGPELENYTLHLGRFKNGSAGDGMSLNDNTQFSTRDPDNDQVAQACRNHIEGAWWFRSCNSSHDGLSSHLNGGYNQGKDSTCEKGISWVNGNWKCIRPKFTEMKLRFVG